MKSPFHVLFTSISWYILIFNKQIKKLLFHGKIQMQIYSIQCLMNPCYQINMANFIVRRDTESHDIFILHFQSTNNFYVLLLEPTSTFLWISIVWLNMPYKENDSNNILDREKKKETVRECAHVWPSVQKVD